MQASEAVAVTLNYTGRDGGSMSDRPGRLDDEDERLLASLVSGNLLVVRRAEEVASAADLDVERATERLADLDEAGLVAEISDDRYTITDEGFEVVVQELALEG